MEISFLIQKKVFKRLWCSYQTSDERALRNFAIYLNLVSKKWFDMVTNVFVLERLEWYTPTFREHLTSSLSIVKRCPKLVVNRDRPYYSSSTSSTSSSNGEIGDKHMIDIMSEYTKSIHYLCLYGSENTDVDRMFYQGVSFDNLTEIIVHVTDDIADSLAVLSPKLPNVCTVTLTDFDVITETFVSSPPTVTQAVIDFVRTTPSLLKLTMYMEEMTDASFFTPLFDSFSTVNRSSLINTLVFDVDQTRFEFPWALLKNVPCLSSLSFYDIQFVETSDQMLDFLQHNNSITDLDFSILADQQFFNVLKINQNNPLLNLDLSISKDDGQEKEQEIVLPLGLKSLKLTIESYSSSTLVDNVIKSIYKHLTALESLSITIKSGGKLDGQVLAATMQHCGSSLTNLSLVEQDSFDFNDVLDAIGHHNRTITKLDIKSNRNILLPLFRALDDNQYIKSVTLERFNTELPPHPLPTPMLYYTTFPNRTGVQIVNKIK